MAELPKAGPDEADVAIARAKEAFPAWRAVAPADRADLMRRLSTAIRERVEELARLEARNVGKPISDARGEVGHGGGRLQLLRGRPGAAARLEHPGRRRCRRDVPGAARRRRPDHPLELPARDRFVEGGTRAGGRQHDRAQAGRAHAPHRRRARADRARRGPSGGRPERGRRARADGRGAHRHAPRRGQGRLHRLDRGRSPHPGARRGHDQARDARAGRQVGERDLRGRGSRAGRALCAHGRLRQRRAGLLCALAHPRRGVGGGPLHGRARGGGRGDPGRRPA